MSPTSVRELCFHLQSKADALAVVGDTQPCRPATFFACAQYFEFFFTHHVDAMCDSLLGTTQRLSPYFSCIRADVLSAEMVRMCELERVTVFNERFSESERRVLGSSNIIHKDIGVIALEMCPARTILFASEIVMEATERISAAMMAELSFRWTVFAMTVLLGALPACIHILCTCL